MKTRIKDYFENTKKILVEEIQINNTIKNKLLDRFSDIEQLDLKNGDLCVWFKEDPYSICFRIKNLQEIDSNTLTNFDLIMKELFDAQLDYFCITSGLEFNFYYKLEND